MRRTISSSAFERLAEEPGAAACRAGATRRVCGSVRTPRRGQRTGAGKTELARARRGGLGPGLRRAAAERALQRLVENPLALKLLEGEFAEGDTVRVDARDGELVFERAQGAAVEA